ncbi:UPF0481 protein At3g47200-like isoform X2 [Juglans microcarpa x Juglans regia]|uniref:UPF0481 protein At3g47200-like isoform X2 n=1 Tax=Juglans microcarpa x Juglans regia TaxID=2249226 RepID=UPI001B7DEDC1|nr:UPF0481 protein At3g47200-like isoform X2 [Juglans microcarpa x Juglans regia]
MEQIFVYPAIHPADDSIKTKDQTECKEQIIDIPPELEASRCPDKYCIYRIPKRLREVNNMAYTPRLVSIGPFHHRSEELKDMDIQKFLILKNFCNRIIGKSIDELKGVIRPKEMEIRSCYSETFLLSSEGFLNMILLDAIFILELFRRKSEKDFGSSKAQEKDSGNSKAHYQIDYILSRPCMERGIRHDLLLLENQLPFFILEELYQHVEPNTKRKTLLELSCAFFGDLYYGWKPESKECFNDLVGCFRPPQNPSPCSPAPSSPNFIEVKHFTDLVRYFFCPPKKEGQKSKCWTCTGCSKEQEDKNKRTKHLHGTATKLDEAGLKFTRPYSERDLLDIKLRPNECLERFPCFNLYGSCLAYPS